MVGDVHPVHGEELVRKAAAAFNAADGDAFAALAHPTFLFVPLLTRSPDGAPYRGVEGARQYVEDAHRWATPRLDVYGVEDGGDVIIARCGLSLRVGDRESTTPAMYVARMRDGLVAEMATLADVGRLTTELAVDTAPAAPAPLTLTLAAIPQNVATVRSAIRAFVEMLDLRSVESIALAVTEAATNAVVHAYRDRDEPGLLKIVAARTADGVLVSVADDGCGLRPRTDSPGLGLGLAIMQHHAAEVAFVGPPQRPAGTEVRLRF